ncbi:MAG: phosphotriesterase-related protein [Desulfobacterota bacterium]|nr:phosphotriesterase-related protein [Thermodesulfobacteriota bacterium]
MDLPPPHGMNMTITTVTGNISPEQLGPTLMHEHVFVQYGGPSSPYSTPGEVFDELVASCTVAIDQMKRYGVRTVVDPTTVDLGRNIPLLVALSTTTSFQIICATGIYSTAVYRRMRDRSGGPAAIADLFVRELTQGIDGSGVRAGIIKVATGAQRITDDERELLEVAAHTAYVTGAPVITHTEGMHGEEQQRILISGGVSPERIIIGHSCLSRDFNYHRRIIEAGSYLAFDRFGMPDMPDEVRVASLHALIAAGFTSRLVVSHDSVWHWVDGPVMGTGAYRNWKPTNFFERIIPMLQYCGVHDADITALLVDNPRRFFSSTHSGGNFSPIV